MVSLGFAAAVALVAALTGSEASAIRPTSYATKTAYWDQRPAAYLDPVALFWKLEAELEVLQLKLLQVQQVSRHGTRYPTDGNMGEIQDVLSKLQTNYSGTIPSWMQNYSLPYNESLQGELSAAGAEELAAYGSRSRLALGTAIPSAYNASKFILQHTYKSRTADSAKAYVCCGSMPSDPPQWNSRTHLCRQVREHLLLQP
jgi:multiple inositol-polyphosphate phosphatase/2,3-bisphosphoglycerate 3-phosphatase